MVSSISSNYKICMHSTANLQCNVLHTHAALKTVAVAYNVTAAQKRVAKQTRERQSNAISLKLEIPSSAHSVCVSCLGVIGCSMFYKQFVGQLPLP